MSNIILASKSPRRKELLSQIGLEYTCIVSDSPEIITQTQPDEVVMSLSKEKAMAVLPKIMETDGITIVIGADTVVVKDGNILGKPRDNDDAFRMLKGLQGNEHSVYTGVYLLILENGCKVNEYSFAECTHVYMYKMTDSEINNYILTEEPMDKAGSYAIQGLGASFIRKIDGDYNNVVGLPVGRIYQTIREYLD